MILVFWFPFDFRIESISLGGGIVVAIFRFGSSSTLSGVARSRVLCACFLGFIKGGWTTTVLACLYSIPYP